MNYKFEYDYELPAWIGPECFLKHILQATSGLTKRGSSARNPVLEMCGFGKATCKDVAL